MRDKIPEITAAQGKAYRFNIASKDEMLDLLIHKLQEDLLNLLRIITLKNLQIFWKLYSAWRLKLELMKVSFLRL